MVNICEQLESRGELDNLSLWPFNAYERSHPDIIEGLRGTREVRVRIFGAAANNVAAFRGASDRQ